MEYREVASTEISAVVAKGYNGREMPPNKSVNRTSYSGPTYSGFAIFASGRATVKRRLPRR